MSLYNSLFGAGDPSTNELLFGLLSADQDQPITPGEFGRFRAIYVTETHIVVHTRAGGNNRDDYFPDWVVDHPLYDYDEDGSFDDTYADIYFRHPAGSEAMLKELAGGTVTPAEKWQALFKALESK